MMKWIFAVCFFWNINLIANAQDFQCYSWEEVKNANPDTVFSISFRKSKLHELPSELSKFKKLRHLDLSQNKLSNLPPFFSVFTELQSLTLSKNKFDSLPSVVCTLPKLEQLIFSQNTIDKIPTSIQALSELRYLDFWDNPIAYFPEELTLLKHLKIVHAEGIKYGPKFQKKWIESMPQTTFYFDPPCDCRE